MATFSSEGIVLGRRDFGEADRLLTIFTKSRGKAVFLAKGVRKVSSRRAPNLELLNRVKFFAHQSKGLPSITEAAAVATYPRLKGTLQNLTLGYLVVELVAQFFEEEQENQTIFKLLTETLEVLDQSSDFEQAKVVTASFQIKALRAAGFLPELYDCVRCKRLLTPVGNYLTPELGGVIDQDCHSENIFARQVGQETIKALRFLEKESMPLVQKLSLTGKQIKEVCEMLNFYSQHFLERPLASSNFALLVEALPTS